MRMQWALHQLNRLLNPYNSLKKLYTLCWGWVCAYTCRPEHMWSERKTCRSQSQFSSFTMCVPGIELRSLGLASGPLTHWVISPATFEDPWKEYKILDICRGSIVWELSIGTPGPQYLSTKLAPYQLGLHGQITHVFVFSFFFSKMKLVIINYLVRLFED